jgi:hypothetical protein
MIQRNRILRRASLEIGAKISESHLMAIVWNDSCASDTVNRSRGFFGC